MRQTALKTPALQDLIQAAEEILEEFDRQNFFALDATGQWEKGPDSSIGRIINELLLRIGKTSEENRLSLLGEMFSPFLKDGFWLQAKKIKLALLEKSKRLAVLEEQEIDRILIRSLSEGGRPEKFYPFLVLLEALAWILRYETVRLSAGTAAPGWDAEATVIKQESLQELDGLKNLLGSLSSEKESEEFVTSILDQLKRPPLEVIRTIPKLIAEEERLIKSIGLLLEKAKDPNRREEFFALIVEKILPPMGIVTLASLSLLRPCLRLLMDKTIGISSGIPYNASVVLSILKDPRSTEALLNAMSLFPLHYSKIRENIIYTLGHLKEKKAAGPIAQVLEYPDEIAPPQGQPKEGVLSLLDQKKEALWALGKIGLESIPHLSVLVRYAEHPSAKLKTYLSWALGEIGKAQKEKLGGVSADIIITLLKLLKTKDRQVFEETVSALRKIDMPEFTHSLYLYNIGAVSILGLKPAQKGLYELSETIHHLIQSKKRAIIAVNGDSGTGKTYFCQSIAEGFADLKPEEILYLMRDRKKDQKIFNRILGLKWLKKYIDPVYYQDCPFPEKDDPDEFFRQFLEKNSNKKLIILDGCRDQHYFQKVIDQFYFKGELDVEVNFRATLSTRRLNLEEREMALESVETHLSFLEEPSLEDTLFYQEGVAILYDLDNSLSSRLNREEIQELFEKRKIDSWGELILVGDFQQELKPLKVEPEPLCLKQENFSLKSEKWPESRREAFSAEERKFKAELNEDRNRPHLLQTIGMNDLKPKKIRFYAQDQICGIGEEGQVFVITFLDNRVFSTFLEKSADIRLLGRDMFLTGEEGELIHISFERNEITRFGKLSSPALSLAALPREKIITGHKDGSVRIWDFSSKSVSILEGHSQAVTSLAVDYSGAIYSGSRDKTLRRWDVARGVMDTIESLDAAPSSVKLYPQGKILVVTEGIEYAQNSTKTQPQKIRIFDIKDGLSEATRSPFADVLSGVTVYPDGRIIAGLRASGGQIRNRDASGTLAIIAPGKDSWAYTLLDGHSADTKDCLVMGPKIITCGEEATGEHTIRIWGTEFYVRMELSKLSLQK